MNGQQKQGNQENYVISKKSKKIDQEESANKKHKGKKNKNQQKQQKHYQYQEDSSQVSQAKLLSQYQKNKLNMLNQLCDMYPNYKKTTIQKFLKQSNYNIQTAADQILETQADNQKIEEKPKEQKVTNIKKKKKNQPKQELNYEAVNDLLGQIYELSGNQFEELFNQITQMIKEDQKQRGKGQLEINNFVDDCASAKQAILVGLIQIFQIDDDIFIDQNDPIYHQTETFLWDLALKGQTEDKLKLQDFPTLGSSSKGSNNNNKQNSTNKSIVNKAQQNYNQNKPKYEQPVYFNSSNKSRPIIFDQYKQHSIFNVDNSQRSEDDLRILHKEYNNVSINRLKIVYKRMEGDFHLCRTFLDKFYGKGRVVQPIIEKVVQSNYEKRKARITFMKAFRKESESEIDQELQQWTYNELRDQIEHLYKLREVFRVTSQKISHSNQRKQLLRLAQQRAPLAFIRKLSKASRVRLIIQTTKNNPLYVDLHGYRQEEVVPVIEGLIASIKQEFDRGNEKIKFRKIGNKTQAILQVMTGKGRHSQYGQSILKPHISNWAKGNELRAISNDDNVEIYIPLL